MYVVKRDGRREPVHFDKITSRVQHLCFGLSELVDPTIVAQKVCSGVYPGVTTPQLDELAAETAAHMITQHPDYGVLAARISVSNLHKNTHANFSDVIHDLFHYIEPKTNLPASLISDRVYKVVMEHADELNAAVRYENDFNYDFFGFKTLERAYLLKINGNIAERPQQMLMRVAVGIHMEDIEAAIETYELMSEKWFTHASPTMFNSGTPRPQMSSCFLLTTQDDSIEGIYDTLKQCAMISKSAGGIGLSIHNVRASGSYIKGTNGTSNGLVPMLRVFNNTARYVDQGGGKRKGSFAMYLEPWHADIFAFLDLKKNHGKEEDRARDLFYAMWVPDLFMKRVNQDGEWSLFCPHEAVGLADTWGEKFEQLYMQYEQKGIARKTVRAREVWKAILDSQIETGTPYMLYKDSCNRKSNQQNLGTIKSSNLCTEIIEYTAPDEVAVCNLASIGLPMFVKNGAFDFQRLYQVVQVITRNLNKIIDLNFYPVKEARNSNMRHRPIGIGIQGLADIFMMLKYPFASPEAKKLNKDIFETIYFGALTSSNDLAREHGPYASYEGSPVSKGVLQYDMWGVAPSDRWDWAALKSKIAEHGVRNSLLVAPMPTASTSQILGNNECFEPYTTNIYTRRVLAGEFMVVNKHLLVDLIERGLWDDYMKNQLIEHSGSVQNIPQVPDDMKELYKTVWEISQKDLIDMAADRAAFIDQSQSMNIHMTDANFGKLTSMHFYAWKRGLKTGLYYLRTRAAADAIKFTVDAKARVSVPKKENVAPVKPTTIPQKSVAISEKEAADIAKVKLLCSIENKDDCAMCGS